MKIENKSNLIFLFLIVLVYTGLTLLCVNHCYFWDNIQQITKEAHWFYLTDFSSLLMPGQNSGSEIVATGYHPPLMGMMTALLWKTIGYKLWVSHIFIFGWALLLIYNVWKLLTKLLPDNCVGWVLLIVLLEPTLLTQFAIASPDFILFAAFTIAFRAVLERKSLLLAIGVIFSCGINMRGIFAGAILFIVHSYYTYLLSGTKFNIRSLMRIILPYLPTLILLAAYFIYYLIGRGWFFADSTSNVHYSLPGGITRTGKHLAEFGIRSVENGRIAIWITGIVVAYATMKAKKSLSAEYRSTLLFFGLLTGLYLLFVFITQMPFSGRYFMPQFFLLTLLALKGARQFYCEKKMRILFIVILCFELTGHFWIYPDKIAKSWDCTLAHLPYYELREECFNYIDQQKLDYNDISAGFCLYGNRRFIELKNEDKKVGTDFNRKYFIYSNISNIEDSRVDELKNKAHWMPIRSFEKGFVIITIYQNLMCGKQTTQQHSINYVTKKI